MHSTKILFVGAFGLGLAAAAGCSSSSSSGTPSEGGTGDDSSSSSGGSSSGGEAGPMINLACMSAADCADAGTGSCAWGHDRRERWHVVYGRALPRDADRRRSAVREPRPSASSRPTTTCAAPTGALAIVASMLPMICQPGGVRRRRLQQRRLLERRQRRRARTAARRSSGGGEAGSDAPTGG